jgi:imidazolonepropionase-like amidohydrolase
MGCAAKEIELYVVHGMAPMDAIQSATRNAAQALGLDDRLGVLEAGKLADIVAVRGDPLSDIRVLQDPANITLVMKEGRVYVDRMGPVPRLVRHPEPGSWKMIDRI